MWDSQPRRARRLVRFLLYNAAEGGRAAQWGLHVAGRRRGETESDKSAESAQEPAKGDEEALRCVAEVGGRALGSCRAQMGDDVWRLGRRRPAQLWSEVSIGSVRAKVGKLCAQSQRQAWAVVRLAGDPNAVKEGRIPGQRRGLSHLRLIASAYICMYVACEWMQTPNLLCTPLQGTRCTSS